MSDQSLVANIALLLWVPVSILVAATLHPTKAFAILFIGGALFLPERAFFKPTALPPFDKTMITSFWILAMAIVRYKKRIFILRPLSGPVILFVILLIGSTFTVLTNKDVLVFGPTVVDRLALNEITHYIVMKILIVATPFLIGAAFFRTSKEIETLLKILIVFALIYTLFILVELRMSPQWHKWIYGYRQHTFRQAIRYGGYRPMVFMEHGLALSLFIAIAAFSAQTLDKIRVNVFYFPRKAVTWYLFVILILCKSTAAIIYGVVFLPAIFVLKPKNLIRIGSIVALLSICYPVLRITESFPTDRIVSFLSIAGEARQGSLAYRFYNEDLMSARALERPLWGWGGHSRGRVYDEQGRELTVIDSFWIALLTGTGLVGMLCTFGILILPLISAYRNFRRIEPQKLVLVAGLSTILSVYVLDLLLNGLFNILPFLFAGSLYGATNAFTRSTSVKSVNE